MNLPSATIALKIGLALILGLLIGFEREWSNKDLGVRTFALTALLAVIAASASIAFAIAVLFGVVALVVLVNLRQIHAGENVELTTGSALLLTYTLGVAVAQGHYYAPAAVAIIATLLLNWKTELHRFAGGLHPSEIRAAVWLGVLAFIIYPLLPPGPVDRWGLVNLHATWVATVVVAAIGFANYVLLRIYSTRGIYYSALLGGVVNSTGTLVELGTTLKSGGAPNLESLSVTVTLLASLAMLARNLVLLAIFAPAAVRTAALPIVLMAALSGIVLLRLRSQPAPAASAASEPLRLGSPVSLRVAFEFGAFFLAVEILGTLAERHWGHSGFYLVSVIGGIFSSASTTTAAGQMVRAQTLTPVIAGVATVLTSLTSTIVNPFAMVRTVKSPQLGRRLWPPTIAIAAIGLLALLALPLAHGL